MISRLNILPLVAAAFTATTLPSVAQSPVGDDTAAGAALYGLHCASCHGSGGEGAIGWQQPNAEGELLPPPHNADGHTWRHADAVLHTMVSEGWRDPFNRTMRLTMPAFGGTLSP